MSIIIALLVFLTATRGLEESFFSVNLMFQILARLYIWLSNLVVSSVSWSSVVTHCPGQNLLWLDVMKLKCMKSYLIHLPFGFTLTIKNRRKWRGEIWMPKSDCINTLTYDLDNGWPEMIYSLTILLLPASVFFSYCWGWNNGTPISSGSKTRMDQNCVALKRIVWRANKRL